MRLSDHRYFRMFSLLIKYAYYMSVNVGSGFESSPATTVRIHRVAMSCFTHTLQQSVNTVKLLWLLLLRLLLYVVVLECPPPSHHRYGNSP